MASLSAMTVQNVSPHVVGGTLKCLHVTPNMGRGSIGHFLPQLVMPFERFRLRLRHVVAHGADVLIASFDAGLDVHFSCELSEVAPELAEDGRKLRFESRLAALLKTMRRIEIVLLKVGYPAREMIARQTELLT